MHMFMLYVCPLIEVLINDVICTHFRAILLVAVSFVPVSYTHLDVYKRQVCVSRRSFRERVPGTLAFVLRLKSKGLAEQ